ncbi:MAG TPA: polyprenol phosphomannose-dependent alpha 1,6 mannosyltransferase MptB [Patescibacteria group bacterium]|nr:polyprenol phosphomannose-dependent alpha 1,6 mannosyltransferase MptB [Patescibacteria group bacterium]
MKKILVPLWALGAIALFFYSFTQIDLSLTFSRVSVWQGIQKAFQYVGYFNRPLSAYLFVGIVLFLFFLYGATLKLAKENVLRSKTLWIIIIGLCIALFLSYNAFSYDIFNYIFDAKILVHYGQSPYEHKALDYPGDPMLSFMHWTHRTYPYGPFWLVLTVPLYFIGFGYFIVTFYLFKLLMLGSFLGSAFFIEKIAKKLKKNSLMVLAAFALNPLVIIESLVSSHNDIVMIFFSLVALYLFLEKKYIKSVISLTLSIAIKFATALLLPAIIAKMVFKVKDELFIYLMIVGMAIGVFLASYRTTFQPWYLILVIPFAALLVEKKFVAIPVFIISLFGLFQYVPYLYLGNWDPPVPMYLNYMLYGSIILSGILILPSLLQKKKSKR